MESFDAREIAFVGEQDGLPERELKNRLAACFESNAHVIEAYLVRVRYGRSPELKVALCLKTDDGPNEDVAQIVAAPFKEMFNNTQSLDILFLSSKHEQEISSIAKPFYRRPPKSIGGWIKRIWRGSQRRAENTKN